MTQQNQIAEAVDTELYVIEKITGNKVVGNEIFYDVKWEGYPKEYDSSEAEWRMTCDEKLIEFGLTKVLNDKYVDAIPMTLRDLEQYQKDKVMILEVLDPLSIFVQTTIQCGSVKFVDGDVVCSKFLLIEYIRDSGQYHLLHSAFVPPDEKVDEDMRRYLAELRFRQDVFPEYPLVKIFLPIVKESVFYSPPLIHQLIFEPVTKLMVENREKHPHIFAPPSEDRGFNASRPFLDASYLKVENYEQDPKYFHHFPQNAKNRLYEGMKRIDRAGDPRFGCNFDLKQELGRGWVLRASHDVDAETPLLMMAGVIAPCSEAHNSLIRVGERVAFSSFIEIPGTGHCLDRRQFHDFTKYIPHSCVPTCSVRLVESGNEYPDLVVYSLVELNEANQFSISLDYYQGFQKDVNRYFWKKRHPDGKIFHLYENKIDFVHCQCLRRKCRGILYVDKSKKADDPRVRKSEKLEELDPRFNFRGMSVVANPSRIWQIREQQFVE